MAEGIIPLNAHKRRDWKNMSDDEVLKIARRFIEDKGIRNPSALERADSGLHHILKRRKLRDKLKFEERRETREWGTDAEMLGIAGKLIEEKGIKSRSGLAKADLGLYAVLKGRKLLDKVRFEERREQRKWGTDEEVLAIAREYLKKEGIRNRKGLENADDGLYQVLKSRKLLDRAFAKIDHASHRQAVQGVLDAMDSFGDDR